MKYFWWQNGIIYQVYPRSFQDSDGDGVGDLAGIVKRLDYLTWLGVTALWVSPVYPSPMADFGYDISDYENIHPIFGSLDDFQVLVNEVHKRKMKLILDFVPNHTSNQHPWFIESRSSRNNPKRDWYIWHDAGAGGSCPNNWLSVFGGPAWEWDENTSQFYYHAFLKEQPDLNWRNPQVVEAMLNAMRFWLDRGVDGFRVDVMWHMIKDAEFRDNPVNAHYQQHQATYEQLLHFYSTDQPEVHDVVSRMRKLLDQYDERMMVGEIYLPINKLVTYYGVDNAGAHLPFNFMLISLPWDAKTISAAIDEYEGALPAGGWPNFVLGNHDQPRITSRVGPEQAKIAAMLLLTLRGTPTIYYGDEIGMRDVPIPFEEVQDPQGLNMPDKNLSRDPARTPMQWSSEKNAGFTEGSPWLRIDEAYERINVQAERDDPYSMLSFYKKLIAFRQSELSMMVGAYTPVFSDNQAIMYKRSHGDEDALLVILNLTHRPFYYNHTVQGTILIATRPETEGKQLDGRICLGGDEGVIVRLKDNSNAV